MIRIVEYRRLLDVCLKQISKLRMQVFGFTYEGSRYGDELPPVVSLTSRPSTYSSVFDQSATASSSSKELTLNNVDWIISCPAV